MLSPSSVVLLSALTLATGAAALPTDDAPRGTATAAASTLQQPAGQGAPPATRGAKQAPKPLNTGPVMPDPERKDFGVVKPEATVTHVFKLVNPLPIDVTIVKSATSCQCTGVDVEGKVIPANGSLEMPASMKMNKAPIKKMASVKLLLDIGAEEPQLLQVELYAESAYAVRAVPGFIDALQPTTMKGTFELVATDDKPFRVISANGSAPVFVGHDPASGPQTKYTLQYDFTKPGTVVPKYFLIETDREDCPLLDLRVRHDTTHIKPPFKVSEFRSSFGKIAPGSVGSFDLELEEVGKHRVASVRSLNPDFTVEMTGQKPDGKNLLLTCSVKPGPNASGACTVPVEIVIANLKYDHLVFGVVR